jgi:hypothetical protein
MKILTAILNWISILMGGLIVDYNPEKENMEEKLIIDCSVEPSIKSFLVSIVKHLSLEKRLDLSKVKLHKTFISHCSEAIFKEKGIKPVNACCLDFLLKNMGCIPKEWKNAVIENDDDVRRLYGRVTSRIYFLGTIYNEYVGSVAGVRDFDFDFVRCLKLVDYNNHKWKEDSADLYYVQRDNDYILVPVIPIVDK